MHRPGLAGKDGDHVSTLPADNVQAIQFLETRITRWQESAADIGRTAALVTALSQLLATARQI